MQCLGKLPAALWVLDLAWHRILQNAGLLERNAIVAEAGHEVTLSLTLHAHVIVLRFMYIYKYIHVPRVSVLISLVVCVFSLCVLF